MTRADSSDEEPARPPAGMAAALLAWYDRHHRDLPWRTPPAALARGARPDPYHVWLSEIMLQQTTVEAVRRYYAAFVARWPDVEALAAADTQAVMKAWAGLGYYSRARNLKACAELVAAEHGGRFPDTEAGLRALPGIGAYTAAAIAAIAFDRPAAVVDGNVERVAARLMALRTPLPAAKPAIRRFVERATPQARPGDFAQATMDLGATICTPRRPACVLCPLRGDCRGLATGDPEPLPLKAPKPDRPLRRGAAFVARRADGAILLRRRPERGLLGGMSEVPSSAWTARQDGATGAEAAPFAADWRPAGTIGHVFTHFALELAVYHAEVAASAAPAGCWWSAPDELPGEALPTVMKKAIEQAVPGATLRQQPDTARSA
ncbi:A/G-specific adenine glycosylase [Aquibium sp. A9E412]|uniref:A/G-specific adenine glycosylase n=1 Tax=Aquibium sp. A9E412 TaxID=2976767 RepID=UPI0025B24A7C|nr:A/G-specific adenine glycosylase [Aquibium sp. A9E412]MDN2566833.1 A/G-specific adenine glycosylase [Aquibium sp. A9E412]